MTALTIDYQDSEKTYEGYLAMPEGEPKGLIVVGHAWGGPADHETDVCDSLAGMGYAAFAYDLYGKGERGSTVEECQALMTPLASNRAKLQDRLKTSIATAQKETGIAADKTVSIGYCFGGLCALDVARAGMDVTAVASFHGLFGAPDNLAEDRKISAKVLILHGYDDPMATPDDMVGVSNELTKAEADWQLVSYGLTKHSFTNKGANNPVLGTVYAPSADQRSWTALTNFLTEVLG